ncbi:MAG: TatD family hydrolase, partial [Myxococcota bacterium]
MLVDTHCHLDAARFDTDRAAMMNRAREAGVMRMITIGCDEEYSVRALGLAATHADVFASVGVHPHEAEKASSFFDDVLAPLAQHPRCVAIGECGLDYYYDHSPRERQREVFARQIA